MIAGVTLAPEGDAGWTTATVTVTLANGPIATTSSVLYATAEASEVA